MKRFKKAHIEAISRFRFSDGKDLALVMSLNEEALKSDKRSIVEDVNKIYKALSQDMEMNQTYCRYRECYKVMDKNKFIIISYCRDYRIGLSKMNFALTRWLQQLSNEAFVRQCYNNVLVKEYDIKIIVI